MTEGARDRGRERMTTLADSQQVREKRNAKVDLRMELSGAVDAKKKMALKSEKGRVKVNQ